MRRISGACTAMMFVTLGVAQPASAQQSVMTAAGYSGYSVTPSAHILPWGTLAFAYDSQVVGGPTSGRLYAPYRGTGHNFVSGFGFLPNVEISGRLASSTIQSNCYSEGCGIRDLSFNFKAGIALDSDKQWNIAAGANDFGGNANFFRTMYGVVSYSPESFDFNIGYARRGSELIGGTRPLNGIFGSAAYQPLPWVQTHIEYNDSKAWAGIKFFAPQEWMPNGWSAHLGINARVAGSDLASRSWASFGLTIPLYKVPTLRAVNPPASIVSGAVTTIQSPSSNSQAPTSSLSNLPSVVREFSPYGLAPSEPLVVSPPPKPSTPGLSDRNEPFVVAAAVSDAQLNNLAEQLRVKGFEDIAVGRMPNGAIAIRVNNATYNVNTVDGLGVALGVVARNLSQNRAGYRLLLTQRQIAIVGVTGQADCLAEWIALKSPRCVAGQLHTPGISDISSLVDGAKWLIDGKAPSWATARLILQPVLSSGVATEYGVFDYSAGLRATLQQPFWRGAYAEVSHVSPLAESSDYRAPNGVFSGSRITNTTDRVMLHQVIRLPLEIIFGEENADVAARWGANAITAHVAAGRINSAYRGTYGEIRWEPFEGRHRFGLEGGRFERTTAYDYFLPIQSRSALASYRYYFTPTKTYVELTAGQFLYNDRGAQFLFTQWFDDVSLSIYLRRTKYAFERAARNFAGVEISIPLTPRKDMTPIHHFQVTGVPQWFYGVETKIGGTNFVSSNQGVFPGVAVLDRTFNYDRSGVSYFEENMSRIRSAASE